MDNDFKRAFEGQTADLLQSLSDNQDYILLSRANYQDLCSHAEEWAEIEVCWLASVWVLPVSCGCTPTTSSGLCVCECMPAESCAHVGNQAAAFACICRASQPTYRP